MFALYDLHSVDVSSTPLVFRKKCSCCVCWHILCHLCKSVVIIRITPCCLSSCQFVHLPARHTFFCQSTSVLPNYVYGETLLFLAVTEFIRTTVSKTNRRQFCTEVVSNYPISFCRNCTVPRFVPILFFCQWQELGLYPLHIALAKQAKYVNNSIYRLTKLPLCSEVGSDFNSRIDLFVVCLSLDCADSAI